MTPKIMAVGIIIVGLIATSAASLYISCMMNGEKVSQRKFSIESGISDVTIRNRSALIKKTLKIKE